MRTTCKIETNDMRTVVEGIDGIARRGPGLYQFGKHSKGYVLYLQSTYNKSQSFLYIDAETGTIEPLESKTDWDGEAFIQMPIGTELLITIGD